MLVLTIPEAQYFNEATSEIITSEEFQLKLEHSLATLSKWEQIHEKPFLSEDKKTPEETLSYIQLMVLDENIPADTWSRITEGHLDQIDAYINRKMTATWFNELGGPTRSREVITAELVYFWMQTFGIWPEAQHWHLNQLFTAIKVHSVKNQPPKKMSRDQILDQQHRLNEQRRAQYGTNG